MFRKDATAILKGNSLSCEGTNATQLGDIISDILLLVPYKTDYGYISYGVYLQAIEVYEKHKGELFNFKTIHLSGHSLGGGIALQVAIFLRLDNYTGVINVNTVGAVKCISKRTAKWISSRANIEWRVRHRDIVPHLGWWSMPFRTILEGEPRKHFMDYDLNEHLMY